MSRTGYLPFVNLNTAKGEHPRMGALDVCPFIPVQDVSVEECVEISKKFGQKMAKGQLIAKGLFAGIVSTKKPTKFL